MAIELGNHFLVFQDEGVFTHPLNAEVNSLPEGTWALSESNEQNRQPCCAFRNAARMRRAWIIQATPPLKKRWAEWEKQCGATLFVMEPFSNSEMAALGLAHFSF